MLPFFIRNTSKVQWSCKFRWLHRRINIKIYQTTNRFELNKKQIFLVKKRDNQIIVLMIMLTRSSERIFNLMRCIGFVLYLCILSIFFKILISSLKNSGEFMYIFQRFACVFHVFMRMCHFQWICICFWLVFRCHISCFEIF